MRFAYRLLRRVSSNTTAVPNTRRLAVRHAQSAKRPVRFAVKAIGEIERVRIAARFAIAEGQIPQPACGVGADIDRDLPSNAPVVGSNALISLLL